MAREVFTIRRTFGLVQYPGKIFRIMRTRSNGMVELEILEDNVITGGKSWVPAGLVGTMDDLYANETSVRGRKRRKKSKLAAYNRKMKRGYSAR